MRSTVAALLLAPILAAAPVPKGQSEAERIEKLFGKPVDLDKDCTFALDGEKLTITVPGSQHGMTAGLPKSTNAPRILRKAEGDVRVRVKMVCKLPPGKLCLSCGAGLIAYKSGREFATLRLTRLSPEHPGKLMYGSVTGGRVNPAFVFTPDPDPADVMWLELTRRGDAVAFAYSPDRVNWHQVGRCPETTFGGDLEVGVFAAQTLSDVFTATFEALTVEPLPAAKK